MVLDPSPWPHICANNRGDKWHVEENDQTVAIVYRHMLNLLSFVSSTYFDLHWMIENKSAVKGRYARALQLYPLSEPISPVRPDGPGLIRSNLAGVALERAASSPSDTQRPMPTAAPPIMVSEGPMLPATGESPSPTTSLPPPAHGTYSRTVLAGRRWPPSPPGPPPPYTSLGEGVMPERMSSGTCG